MDIGTRQQTEWGRHAFVDPSDLYINQQYERWTALGSSSEHTLSISSFPLIEPVEKHDQFAEYQEFTPSKLCGESVRETSVQVEQPSIETLFLAQQPDSFQQRQKAPIANEKNQQPSSKRRHASKKMPSNPIELNNNARQPVTNCEPARRKRGRPRLYPPIIEAQTPNVSSIHVSSARKFHLEQNRAAADKCRQHRKEYVTWLMAKVSKLCFKNKTRKADETVLREQVLDLKNEVLCHARCGSRAIDKYIAQSAGNLFGLGAPSIHIPAPRDSAQPNILPTLRESSLPKPSPSLPSQVVSNSSMELEAYNGRWFLDDHETMKEQ
jgi:hypothetical protein